MKIWLCLVSILLCAHAAWAQPPLDYPNVPRSNPAYVDLTIIYDSTLLIECVYGFTGKLPPMSRYEFAVATARLIQNLPPLERTSQTLFTGKAPPVYTALARLIVQFAPELHSLGISSSALNSAYIKLTGEAGSIKDYAVSPPFDDVAPAHWAFSAVERLRINGILLGKRPR